jgi:multidrug efflux pump subunit AcrB
MLMGMMVFNFLGITLNMVVLFSLVLVLGMLVDNAIVLVENIYRHNELGKSAFDSAVDGAKEVALPVAASTLTTVAAFAPLLGWTGLMGEFMVYLPITLVTVLLSSLVVAIVMLPVLASIAMKSKPRKEEQGESKNFILRLYRVSLVWALRHRKMTLVAMVATLVGSFMAYGALNHGTEFFPDVEPDRATVTVRAADGTDLEETDRVVREIEEILLKEKQIKTYVAETGVVAGDFSSSEATNQARITLNFYPHASKARPGEVIREEDTRLTLKRLRKQVAHIVGAEIKIEKERQGPPVGKPIAIEVSSKSYQDAGEFASKARRAIAAVPGVTGVEDNYRVGRPELRFRVDRGAAKRVGASTAEVANAVRAAVSGTKASAFRDGEDEYDIMVELAPEYREDMQSVLSLRVPGREDMELGTFSVPISSVASYQLAGGTGSINHKSQQPVVTIGGDVKEGFNQNEVQAAVMKVVDEMDAPPGVRARLGGANDEQAKSQAFLMQAFLMAVFLIAIVLVAQFNRFGTPIIVLLSVVMSLVGVLWGLVLTGTAFGIIMTGLGVISLAGVVVNNAIVLLDYVQLLRDEGRPRDEAVIEAGMTRFRPVMLTAVTTILGLVPMAVGLSIEFALIPWESKVFWGTQSSEWWGPMAVAVIFGLAFATLLTLIAVPTLYVVFDNVTESITGFFKKVGKSPAAVGASEGPAQGAPSGQTRGVVRRARII